MVGTKKIENKNVASGKRVEEVNEERRRRPERGDVRTGERGGGRDGRRARLTAGGICGSGTPPGSGL